MSGTFPASPAPYSCTVESYEPAYKTTAHSLRRIVRSRGAQRWMFVLKYPPMPDATFRPFYAWLMAQAGIAGTFTFYPPAWGTVLGSLGGTPLIKTTTAAGQTSIPSKGWTPGNTVLKAGDFVKFQSHAKVYMLSDDAVADGAGEVALPIRPILVEQVTVNSTITASQVPFQCAIDNDMIEADRTPGGWVNMSELHLLEVP